MKINQQSQHKRKNQKRPKQDESSISLYKLISQSFETLKLSLLNINTLYDKELINKIAGARV